METRDDGTSHGTSQSPHHYCGPCNERVVSEESDIRSWLATSAFIGLVGWIDTVTPALDS